MYPIMDYLATDTATIKQLLTPLIEQPLPLCPHYRQRPKSDPTRIRAPELPIRNR